MKSKIFKEHKKFNPLDLTFSNNLINEKNIIWNNKFICFKNIEDILYLLYVKDNNSMILYNILTNKKIVEIKNCHNLPIQYLEHCLDKINKRDIVLSISTFGHNLKIWNIKNWECIYNFKNININKTSSGCFLFDHINHNYYILVYNIQDDSLPIKIFNFNGEKVKEINNTYKKIILIKCYYDKKFLINYLIFSTSNFICSYNFDKSKLFKKYLVKENKFPFYQFLINDIENITKLIGINGFNIIVWNFHSGEIIDSILIDGKFGINDIYLWSKEYLLASFANYTLKAIKMKPKIEVIKKNIINNSRSNDIIKVQKIIHPLFGISLLAAFNEKNENNEFFIKIKLYTIKNNFK